MVIDSIVRQCSISKDLPLVAEECPYSTIIPPCVAFLDLMQNTTVIPCSTSWN